MSWVNFSLSVEGLPAFERKFNRVADDFKDFRPIWVEVGKVFYDVEKKLFASSGASGASGKWAPLKPKYAAIKAKKWPAGAAAGPMHRTFATRNSLTKGGAGAVYQSNADELTIGTGLDYPGYHLRASGNRPARKVIDMTEKDLTAITKTIQRELLKSVKREGFDVAGYEQMKGFKAL